MSELAEFMRKEMVRGPIPDGIERLGEAIRQRHPGAVSAILLYGSCRRSVDVAEGLADLLVVVSSYRAAFGTGLLALFNQLLPPNVFYLETGPADRPLRCKYAVVSERQFARRAESRSDHYFWARFCQPLRLVGGDDAAAAAIAGIRARCATSFARRATPLLRQPADACSLWARAMALTYRCELRPEPPENAERLIAHDPSYWQQLTKRLATESPWLQTTGPDGYQTAAGPLRRASTRISWSLRMIAGKAFNLARLFKAAGTFTDGVDYIAWKIERHSGVRIEPTERMRRYPRLAIWGMAWRTWRQGGFR